jgi:hypothetical protein
MPVMNCDEIISATWAFARTVATARSWAIVALASAIVSRIFALIGPTEISTISSSLDASVTNTPQANMSHPACALPKGTAATKGMSTVNATPNQNADRRGCLVASRQESAMEFHAVFELPGVGSEFMQRPNELLVGTSA